MEWGLSCTSDKAGPAWGLDCAQVCVFIWLVFVCGFSCARSGSQVKLGGADGLHAATVSLFQFVLFCFGLVGQCSAVDRNKAGARDQHWGRGCG